LKTQSLFRLGTLWNTTKYGGFSDLGYVVHCIRWFESHVMHKYCVTTLLELYKLVSFLAQVPSWLWLLGMDLREVATTDFKVLSSYLFKQVEW